MTGRAGWSTSRASSWRCYGSSVPRRAPGWRRCTRPRAAPRLQPLTRARAPRGRGSREEEKRVAPGVGDRGCRAVGRALPGPQERMRGRAPWSL
jgi:hypothetical protein